MSDDYFRKNILTKNILKNSALPCKEFSQKYNVQFKFDSKKGNRIEYQELGYTFVSYIKFTNIYVSQVQSIRILWSQ